MVLAAVFSCGPSAPAPSPSETAIPAAMSNAILNEHNAVRREAGPLPPLEWDEAVASFAQAWAAELKTRTGGTCDVRKLPTPHRPSTGDFAQKYGENIAWYAGERRGEASVVRDWASEKQNYDYAANSCAAAKQCGHYTQIAWRNSVRLGCAVATCDGGEFGVQQIWVCNYDPPGNVVGEKPY